MVRKVQNNILKISLLVLMVIQFLFADIAKVVNKVDQAVFRIINFAGNGTGTGFVVNKDGYIITNHHVIDGYKPNELMILNKYFKSKDVKVIQTYPKKDIAILKINDYSLSAYLKFEKSSKITKGSSSIAIGFPGAADIVGGTALYESKVTQGIISAVIITDKDSEYGKAYKLIQTSSAINSGNSGGPLLSKDGNLIGINTFKSISNPTNKDVEGVGYAIHTDELREVLYKNDISFSNAGGLLTNINDKSSISEDDANHIGLAIKAVVILALLYFFVWRKKKKSKEKNITDTKEERNYILVGTSGYYKDNQIPININEQVIIGGAVEEANIIINDNQKVSRVHCIIKNENGNLTITDKSTNGTFVNKNKIDTNIDLNIGDIIWIVDSKNEFKIK